MASFLARYLAGEHEAVWREINHAWTDVIDYGRDIPSASELDEIMGETFARVARNTDRIIARLRDTGYRFECEAGRHSAPTLPRSAVPEGVLDSIEQALTQHFEGLKIYPEESRFLPRAFVAFGTEVGQVDLRQRYPPAPILQDRQLGDIPDDLDLPPAIRALMEGLIEARPEPDPAQHAQTWPSPKPMRCPILMRTITFYLASGTGIP